MDQADQLRKMRQRLDLVIDHLEGASQAAIGRRHRVSRPTVAKWIRRFEAEGVEGLLSRTSSGRPRRVSRHLRSELVRLPSETRPPEDLGERWTTRLLADLFGVDPSFVSRVWAEAGFDPPQHLQQVHRNPFRLVPLRVELRIPAWEKLHYELLARERGQTLDGLVRACLLGGEHVDARREEVWSSVEPRWHAAGASIPRVDPRKVKGSSLLRRTDEAHDQRARPKD